MEKALIELAGYHWVWSTQDLVVLLVPVIDEVTI